MNTFDSTLAGPRADPLLRTMFPEWESYRSPAQSWAVQMLRTAPPGGVVLTVMATGGGKTLTYALPLMEELVQQGRSRALVIVPTISLATDQAMALSHRYASPRTSIRASAVHSGLNTAERQARESAFVSGDTDVLLVSPERALQPEFVERLRGMGDALRFLVIDEVHMMLDWGETFRLEYPRLGWLRRELLSSSPSLRTHLMSATVPPASERRLKNLFVVSDDLWRTVRGSTLRFEAEIEVQRLDLGRHEGSLLWLKEHIDVLRRPGLVYLTRPIHADQTADAIRSWGYTCAAYHGNTDQVERDRISEEWIVGGLDFVAATSAFGLGIDKSDVRSVTHLCIPESLDRYYQEIGRAGRDGRWCLANLVTVEEDVDIAEDNAKRLLGLEKFEARWLELLNHGECIEDTGTDAYWLVDESRLPSYATPRDASRGPGDFHTQWNRSLVNFLERFGLLSYEGWFPASVSGRVTDRTIAQTSQQGWRVRNMVDGSTVELSFSQAPGPGWQQTKRQMLQLWRSMGFGTVKWKTILRVDRRAIDQEESSREAFFHSVELSREAELKASYQSIDQMVEYARRAQGECYRAPIARLYGEALYSCGACQWCISKGLKRSAIGAPTKPRPWNAFKGNVNQRVQSLSKSNGLILVHYRGAFPPELLNRLERGGFQQFVLPRDYSPRSGIVHWIEDFVPDETIVESVPTIWILPLGLDDLKVSRVLSFLDLNSSNTASNRPWLIFIPDGLIWTGSSLYQDRFEGRKVSIEMIEASLPLA